MNNRDKRVLVGMSGGIDSSATCIMLQEQGYEVVGVGHTSMHSPQAKHPSVQTGAAGVEGPTKR